MFRLAAIAPVPELNASQPESAPGRRGCTGLDRQAARSQGVGTVTVPWVGRATGARA
jgi:hypothetical protein